MRASSSGSQKREKLTAPEHESGACRYVRCASEFADQNHSPICGRGGEHQPRARLDAGGVIPDPDRLVGDEEELGRVGERQQHRARLQQLEEHVPDEPVVEEELAYAEGRAARSSCASSRGRRSTGSRCRAPCPSSGTGPPRSDRPRSGCAAARCRLHPGRARRRSPAGTAGSTAARAGAATITTTTAASSAGTAASTSYLVAPALGRRRHRAVVRRSRPRARGRAPCRSSPSPS